MWNWGVCGPIEDMLTLAEDQGQELTCEERQTFLREPCRCPLPVVTATRAALVESARRIQGKRLVVGVDSALARAHPARPAPVLR